MHYTIALTIQCHKRCNSRFNVLAVMPIVSPDSILYSFTYFVLGFMNAPRLILDLNNGDTSLDEDVARDISNKLYEEKDTLLRKYDTFWTISFFTRFVRFFYHTNSLDFILKLRTAYVFCRRLL